MIVMVSRIRRTLTVQERAAAFEHTNKVAAETAEEERRLREERTNGSASYVALATTLREALRETVASCGIFVTLEFGDQDMDQHVTSTSTANRLRDARLAKGYSLEDLAIATRLTVAEITAAEEPHADPVPEHHV